MFKLYISGDVFRVILAWIIQLELCTSLENYAICEIEFMKTSLYKNHISKTFDIMEISKISGKCYLSIMYLIKKNLFSISETSKTRPCTKYMWFSMLKKIVIVTASHCFFQLKDHLSWFLKYHANFVNTKEMSSFYQLYVIKMISFYSQKSILSAISLSFKFITLNFTFF